MKTLQASMILKNEEQMLPKALDSLKGIDSIMICDTGSTDKSFDIYKEYQKKGYNLEWFKYSRFNADDHIRDFSHARNECKEKCTGDWLFILDGDEWFDFGIEKVKKMINSGWVGDYDVLAVDVKTPHEQTQQPRVFRNKPDIWYYSEFHNSLSVFPNGREGRVELFSQSKFYKTSFLIHAEFSPNHKIYPDRTKTIIRDVLKKRPNDSRAVYYYGRELLNQEDPDPFEALFYLLYYTEITPATKETAEVYFIIATIYVDLHIGNKAIEYAFKCVQIMPSYNQAWQIIHAMAHPELKPYWKKMLDSADNKGLMIVRK